ncbi:hypothetical protein CEXT_722791, partial [Caerostris extrusa]
MLCKILDVNLLSDLSGTLHFTVEA